MAGVDSMESSSTAESTEATTSAPEIKSLSQPVCLIVLGMAGSGKTTLINKLTQYLHSKESPPYVLNLDPACREVPYPANIGKSEIIIINTTLTFLQSVVETGQFIGFGEEKGLRARKKRVDASAAFHLVVLFRYIKVIVFQM